MVGVHQDANAVSKGPELDTLSMMVDALRDFGGRASQGAQAPGVEFTGLEDTLRLREVRTAQAGLVADMDRIADSIYHRCTNDQPE